MNIRSLLDQRLRAAMNGAGIASEFAPLISLSKKPEFGDYQANGAMGAAKAMQTKPRDLAQKIVDALDLDGIADKIEIAGPGFINIHLDPAWLAQTLQSNLSQPKLGISHTGEKQTIVVDYSSPNLAKEMHVGHLRSTIIGDTLARLFEFLGHKVIRQNHVGDWGTQFGMLLAELEKHLAKGENEEFALQDLESFYQQAKKNDDSDPEFAARARAYVVKLQSGDQAINQLWQRFRATSLHHSEEIYQKLGVTLTPDDVCGESFYNDDLPKVINDLNKLGLLKEDQGAKVVFIPELANKEGEPSVAIIQKSDGGYNYATTDLAAIRHRLGKLNANRVMILTDARQALHFNQVFTIAKKAGFAPLDFPLQHIAFGKMLGEDGKPFKTRDGGTVKLASLLEEAIERAEKLIAEKDPDLDIDERKDVAVKVGIGAVKYADLCKTRTNDYVFNWDSMLSFEGNTAPYLQYAYTRIQSIFRKAEIAPAEMTLTITVSEKEENALALQCLRLIEVLEQVADEAYPHILCNYLYELASLTMAFYEACPILKDGVPEPIKLSRLSLCFAVATTLKTGLDLLGIEVMERM